MHVHALFPTTHISTYVLNVQLAAKNPTPKDTVGPKGIASQVPINSEK